MKLAALWGQRMSTFIDPGNESVRAPLRKRFTVDEFQRMGAAGIFDPDARLELIEGEILEMTPIGSRHFACVIGLDELLWELLGKRATVSVQGPLQLSASQPLPDIAVLRRRADRYRDRLPGPTDCLFVVEVADSSVSFDRKVKAQVYAGEGVVEFWVVDLTTATVVLHLNPGADGYGVVREYARGEAFASPALGGRELSVDELLDPGG
jgi:Uma2 family endonuclease